MQKYVDEQGHETEYIGRRNNFKMPAYHRLDLSFNYYRHKKNGRMGIWNLSIYNAYSHHNSFLIMQTQKELREDVEKNTWRVTGYKPVIKSFSIFPIIPSFSYTYKF